MSELLDVNGFLFTSMIGLGRKNERDDKVIGKNALKLTHGSAYQYLGSLDDSHNFQVPTVSLGLH